MVYLLDANVILRFLIGDDKKHLAESIEIFKKIETAQLQVEILEGVLMEVYDLKTILALNGVINSNKAILFEALNIVESKSVDFVDALICAKSKLQGFGKISFDGDLKKC